MSAAMSTTAEKKGLARKKGAGGPTKSARTEEARIHQNALARMCFCFCFKILCKFDCSVVALIAFTV